MNPQDEEKDKSGRIISLIIVTIFNYFILKVISDELKKRGITRFAAFGYIMLFSSAIMILTIIGFIILKSMGVNVNPKIKN